MSKNTEDERRRAREVLFGAPERNPDLLPDYDADTAATPAKPVPVPERYLRAVLAEAGVDEALAARAIARHAHRITATPTGLQTLLPSGGKLPGMAGLKALGATLVREARAESREPEQKALAERKKASGLYNRL